MPSSARIYDYLLGGKDNYDVDREIAHRLLAIAPDTKTLAWFSRQFLLKTVESAVDAGVRQFIELGAGIPTKPSVHEVARRIDTSAHVVYIDHDPIVHVHCDALLAGPAGVTAMKGDIRQPDDIIDRLRTGSLIDFNEPVAVLMIGVLDHVMDDERPAWIIARFRDMMAPGSYLALTHPSNETHPDLISQSQVDLDNSPAQTIYRSKEAIASFVEGFELIEPGITPIQNWLGDDLPATRLVLLGGLCRRSNNRGEIH